MSDKTKIEWTDATWNPLRGCSRVSEGCRNCYAERVAARFSGPGLPYEGLTTPAGNWNGKVKLVEDHLTDPLKWKKPRKIFVNSMSDLFHESVPFDWIDKIFAVMALCPQHTFQVLTKRAKRMAEYMVRRRVIYDGFSRKAGASYIDKTPCDDVYKIVRQEKGHECDDLLWPLPNVWLGVSVEDQQRADERIPHLLRCPAAVRWLSVEPMLGPLNITGWIGPKHDCDHYHSTSPYSDDYPSPNPEIRGCTRPENVFAETNRPWERPGTKSCQPAGCPIGYIGGIHWVVCGGESGPGARPMHPDWVRGLRDQCVNAGVPFFFKQWGEFGPWFDEDRANHDGLEKWGHIGIQPDGGYGDIAINPDSMLITNYTRDFNPENCFVMAKCGKKASGRMLDGRTWDEFPQAVQA